MDEFENEYDNNDNEQVNDKNKIQKNEMEP